jgi:tRNA wybutosine-synthesizing protein 3
MVPPNPALPQAFNKRKALILSALSVPAEQYDDFSPKGSIDEGIRDLIQGINAREGWVTTSSCSGRVSVFVEGTKRKAVMRTGERRVDGAGKRREEENEMDRKGRREEGGDGEQNGYDEGKEEGNEDEDGHVDGDKDSGDAEKATKSKLAGAGGKGGGGRWLFVSHEPVDINEIKGKAISSFLGMKRMGEVMDADRQFTEERLIHFKFEPMVRGLFRFFEP